MICFQLKVQIDWESGEVHPRLSLVCVLCGEPDVRVAGGAEVCKEEAPILHLIPLPCGRLTARFMQKVPDLLQTGLELGGFRHSGKCHPFFQTLIFFPPHGIFSHLWLLTGCWDTGETFSSAFTEVSSRVCCRECIHLTKEGPESPSPLRGRRGSHYLPLGIEIRYCSASTEHVLETHLSISTTLPHIWFPVSSRKTCK